MGHVNLLNDNELTLLLAQGNGLAFTEIYNRYWDRLYFVALRLLKDTNAAEEIVQDVFFTLWKKRADLTIHSLTQYLAAMTRYAVYRHLAKDKQSKLQEHAIGIQNAGTVAEINIDNKLLLEFILELSAKLPEKCRLVFQYNKLHDRPLAEVAERLNISQKTAEGHLTKALRMIRANFGDTLGDFFLLLIVFATLKR